MPHPAEAVVAGFVTLFGPGSVNQYLFQYTEPDICRLISLFIPIVLLVCYHGGYRDSPFTTLTLEFSLMIGAYY